VADDQRCRRQDFVVREVLVHLDVGGCSEGARGDGPGGNNPLDRQALQCVKDSLEGLFLTLEEDGAETNKDERLVPENSAPNASLYHADIADVRR
jgi:hypothetical protein